MILRYVQRRMQSTQIRRSFGIRLPPVVASGAAKPKLLRAVADRSWRLQSSGARCCASANSIKATPQDGHAAAASATDVRPVAASMTSNESRWWHVWKYRRLRLLLRALRVAFLAGSLYHVGYSSGLHDYALDPDGCQKKLVKEVLMGNGAVDEKGHLKLSKKGSPSVLAVRRVFPRILEAAKEEIQCQEQSIKERLKQDENDSEAIEELKRIQGLKRSFNHWAPDGFLVLDEKSPNAYVHGLVPRMVFVHSGLLNTEQSLPVPHIHELDPGTDLVMLAREGLEYRTPCSTRRVTFRKPGLYSCSFVREDAGGKNDECVVKVPIRNRFVDISVPVADINRHWTYSVCESDEQLAMVLSHELSHVIHGHSGSSLQLSALTITVQLVLLSLLDVTGLVSLLSVVGMAPVLKYTATLPFSREQELEADATGLRIVARARYSPKNASVFFERLAAFSTEVGGSSSPAWRSTHPPTEDRVAKAKDLEAEATMLYESRVKDERDERWRQAATLGYLMLGTIVLGGVGVVAAL